MLGGTGKVSPRTFTGLRSSDSSRDDLTVEVIFFGESDHSGNVVLNPEASASGANIKARL